MRLHAAHALYWSNVLNTTQHTFELFTIQHYNTFLYLFTNNIKPAFKYPNILFCNTHLSPGPRSCTCPWHFPFAKPIFTSQKNRTLLLLHIECIQCRVWLFYDSYMESIMVVRRTIVAAGRCRYRRSCLLITIDWNLISRSYGHTHTLALHHSLSSHTNSKCKWG